MSDAWGHRRRRREGFSRIRVDEDVVLLGESCTDSEIPEELNYVSLSSNGIGHFMAPVHLETSTTSSSHKAMIDSGASSSFISQNAVRSHKIPTTKKAHPFRLVDIARRPLHEVTEEVCGTLLLGD